jgi:hypothetical protein
MKDYSKTMWKWIAAVLAEPRDDMQYRHDWLITEVTVINDNVTKEHKATLAFNLMMNHYAGEFGEFEYIGSWVEMVIHESLMDQLPTLRIVFELWIYG